MIASNPRRLADRFVLRAPSILPPTHVLMSGLTRVLRLGKLSHQFALLLRIIPVQLPFFILGNNLESLRIALHSLRHSIPLFVGSASVPV